MKNIILALVVLHFVASFNMLQAQTGKAFLPKTKNDTVNSHNHKNWNFEKAKAEQSAFFAKELNLSPEQADKLTDAMGEYMKKRISINMKFHKAERQFEQKLNKTDQDYLQMTDLATDKKIMEAKIDKEYYTLLTDFITPKEVLKYDSLQRSFIRQLMIKRKDWETKK